MSDTLRKNFELWRNPKNDKLMTLEDKDRYSESATETENTSRFKCFRTGISGGFTTKNKGYKLSLSTRRLNDQKLKAFPISLLLVLVKTNNGRIFDSVWLVTDGVLWNNYAEKSFYIHRDTCQMQRESSLPDV